MLVKISMLKNFPCDILTLERKSTLDKQNIVQIFIAKQFAVCMYISKSMVNYFAGGFNLWALVRLILPGVWLLWEPSLDTLYAFLFSINVIGFLFMSVLIYYYTGLLVTNMTTHESNNRKGQKYDYGRDHNIKVRRVICK